MLTSDFSKKGIVRAIKQGNFYASTGPQILDLRIVGGILEIHSTPVCAIRVICSHVVIKEIAAKQGSTIQQATWRIDETLDYFRIELLDAEAYTAWSQPVFIDDWYLNRA